jgi:hypothetical protein
MIPPLFGKQEVGIWRVKKRFPRYGVPIWSLWPNIRFLPSIVAEKNVTKKGHICSMCIKINKVGKQEVSIWCVQERFPRSYRYPISWEAFFDPSDSYFLFAEERGYHKWALAHSSSCLDRLRSVRTRNQSCLYYENFNRSANSKEFHHDKIFM